MFSRNRETHHESGTTRSEYDPLSTASSLCFAYPATRTVQDFQRNLQPAEAGRGINISGVDFWHAVEFSRNGRFLCTHPRDSLRLSSGRFPSVLRFRLYQIFFRSDFLGAFQVLRVFRSAVSLSGGSDFIRSSEPV